MEAEYIATFYTHYDAIIFSRQLKAAGPADARTARAFQLLRDLCPLSLRKGGYCPLFSNRNRAAGTRYSRWL